MPKKDYLLGKELLEPKRFANKFVGFRMNSLYTKASHILSAFY